MSKYENGYLPKIQYWNERLENALGRGDIRMAEMASMKLRYFTERQAEVYGNPNVIAGVDFSDSLEALYHLGRS